MKRLVYRNVYSSEDILAEEGLINKIKKFIDDLFSGLDKTLSIIESWGEDLQEPDADINDLKNNHTVYEILPTQDNEDWDKGDVYRVLMKAVDFDDDCIFTRFDMKGKDGSKASEVAKIALPEGGIEGEMDSDYLKRFKKMIDVTTKKLLKECSDNQYDEIAEYRDVIPGQ